MAKCLENNTVVVVPYECPPLVKINCTNGREPVLKYDENLCCPYYECDCHCNGWGDPHYTTFDGVYYSYQGNCSYVLVEEITPKFDNFGVYIDNVHCDIRDQVSCPRSIIVTFDTLVVELRNTETGGRVKLQVLVNKQVVSLPFAKYGMKIYSSKMYIFVEIPEIKAVISFSGIAFTIDLPYHIFGNNTQGQCGTCTNNQADDCMLPGGQLINDCAVMADYWPVKDPNKVNCVSPSLVPTNRPPSPTVPAITPCVPDSLCNLLKSSVFAECHRRIPADNFFQACVFDGCHMQNSSIECSSLQTYASMCASVNICIDWRSLTRGKCPSNCSPNMVYKPCGPAEQPTCALSSFGSVEKQGTPMKSEGCFCPEGSMLFSPNSDVCVKKCGCLDPHGVPREFDEKFEHNCQDCVCSRDTYGVQCFPRECPANTDLTCSGPGFIVVNETSLEDPCCRQLICRCNISLCSSNDPTCKLGFKPVMTVKSGECCPTYTCVPKGVCVHNYAEYMPGGKVPVNECQVCSCTENVDLKTKLNVISCIPIPCNYTCEPGFKNVESQTECCGKCIQNQCVVHIQDGATHLLEPGETWSPPDNKCALHGCMKIKDSFISTLANIACPPFHETNCQPGTIETTPDGCCKTCLEKQKDCKLTTVNSYITYQGCQSTEKIAIMHCAGTCGTFSKYSAEAASMEHRCTCCQEAKTHNVSIVLTCPGGKSLPYTYIQTDQCDCVTTSCEPLLSVQRQALPNKKSRRSVPRP